jgi:hypothetical protein
MPGMTLVARDFSLDAFQTPRLAQHIKQNPALEWLGRLADFQRPRYLTKCDGLVRPAGQRADLSTTAASAVCRRGLDLSCNVAGVGYRDDGSSLRLGGLVTTQQARKENSALCIAGLQHYGGIDSGTDVFSSGIATSTTA